MQQRAEPARAEARSEQEADEKDERDLQSHHPSQRGRREEDRYERPEKARGLKAAKEPEHHPAIVEDRAHVFRETLPRFRERAVHPDRGKFERLAVEEPLPLGHECRDLTSERDILDNMRAHRPVPANACIGAAREKHELPVCDAQATHIVSLRALGLALNPLLQPQRAKRETDEHDDWHDQLFAGRVREQSRPCGDEARAILLRVCDRGGHGARRVLGVGIREK